MISIPIALFVIFVLNVFLELLFIIWCLTKVSANKKDYEEYIEEEYGEESSTKKGN